MLLITALVPLAMAPGLLSAFDITPKIAILLFCESALLFFCKQLVKGARALFESTPGRLFLACLGAQWISTAVSTLGSSNALLSVEGSSWRHDGLIVETAILLFAFMVAAWLIDDNHRLGALLRTATLAGAIASLYGIAQYFGWDPFLAPRSYLAGEGPFTIVRPPGTLGHADYFANWLVMVAYLALALTAVRNDRRWKVIARVTIGLAAFAILLSGTRSALLGLIVGAMVFLAVARPRIDRTGWAVLAAAMVALAVLFASPAGMKLRARVHWSLDDVRGGARVLLWRDSLHMAAQHPILGFGPETFTSQFAPFESVELARAYPDFYQESPHNMFLDTLTARGLAGLLVLIALCAVAFWTARGNAALLAALSGAMVCQQFVVLTVPTELYFYLVIAIAVATAAPHKAEHTRGMSRIAVLVPAVVGIVFAVFATRLLLGGRAQSIAEQRIALGDVPGAADAYRSVQKWDPRSGDGDLRYSRAMARLVTTTPVFATGAAAAQQAYDSAVRATQTAEDRQNAWYNLATIAALRNDAAGVEDSLRHAIASAPNWFKPHWTLAQFLELTGRHAEARAEAARALELNGNHDAEVAASCAKILSRP